MKKLLCLVGCLVLVGSNLTFATSNENRTEITFKKAEAVQFQDFTDDYTKREEGQEVFGNDNVYLKLVDIDGNKIKDYGIKWEEDGTPIPAECFDDASKHYNQPCMVMQYGGRSYDKTTPFLKYDDVNKDITVVALRKIILVENNKPTEGTCTVSRLGVLHDPPGTYLTVSDSLPVDKLKLYVQYNISRVTGPFSYKAYGCTSNSRYCRNHSRYYTFHYSGNLGAGRSNYGENWSNSLVLSNTRTLTLDLVARTLDNRNNYVDDTCRQCVLNITKAWLE